MYFTRPKRINANIAISAKTIGSLSSYRGTAINISTTGILVKFQKEIPFKKGGSIIEVNCTHNNNRMKFLCKLIRESEDGTKGLSIIQIDESDLVNWNQMIISLINKEEKESK